jgi:outer membrane protein
MTPNRHSPTHIRRLPIYILKACDVMINLHLITIKKTVEKMNLLMKIKWIGILLAATMFSFKDLQARQPLQLSLQQAKDYAIEHSYELKNARADANIARKQVWEITADGLPQVSGSVGYQNFLDLPISLLPPEFAELFGTREIQFGTKHNLSATLSVTQLLFDGSYIVGLQAARIYRELAQQNLQRSEIEIRNTVAQTYYLSLVAGENLKILRENFSNMEKTSFETQKMFEAGFMDAINVDQLKLTLTNMKNTITNLERQEKLTLQLLKFQMGIDINQDVELSDNLENLFRNISLDSFMVEDFNPENHIDYKLLLSQERMQIMAMRRQRSFYLPSLAASYTRQENAMRNEFNFLDGSHDWFPTSVLGVSLNIPIFSSGMRHSRIQQAKLEVEKARNNTQQVGQSLLLQKQDAQAEIDNALLKYNNEKENLELAERILHRTRIMFQEGMASSLELTQASDQMLTTQANYINAMFEMLNAKNKLDKVLGRL